MADMVAQEQMAEPAAVQAPPPMAEVTRAEFEALQQQVAGVEQAVTDLVYGLKAEREDASREEFYSEFHDDFADNHAMSDRAWQMYEDSGKTVDRREFVTNLVSQMDGEMLEYFAKKGMELMAKKEESQEAEGGGEPSAEPGEDENAEPGEPSGEGETAEGSELTDRDKISRLLTQNG